MRVWIPACQRRAHCWLAWPLQDHRMSWVPLPVPWPLASRQRLDCTPVIVPLALTVHCWLVCPLQSQMTTDVPLVVPWLSASRHLLPRTISWRLAVVVQDWLACPLQSHSCTWVPLVVLAFGTSTHRPDWVPTICRPWLAASVPVTVSRTAWPAGTVV